MAKTAKVRTLPFGFRLQHREFIASLTSGSSYAFDLSVTDADTFPWLSQVAVYFDQYRVWKCRVVQETAVSASTSGTAAIAYEPNASDEPPSTLAGLLQMAIRDSGALWQNHSISVPSAQLNRAPGPVRFTHISAENDPLLRSFGTILLNSDGGSPLAGYANLYIEYDIELLNPQPAPALSNVPDESSAVVQMPQREENVDLNWGGLLTPQQASALTAGLCKGVQLLQDSTITDRLLETGTNMLEAFPLELEFREPGQYLVTLAHNGERTDQDHHDKEFAALAGWTSGIKNILWWAYGTPYTNPDYLIGTGPATGYDADLKSSSWLFDVGSVVDNFWRTSLGVTDFISKPTFPRIALGRYNHQTSGYSGWTGYSNPLLYLSSLFPNYEGPQLRVTRHPRFSTINMPPSAVHLDGPLTDSKLILASIPPPQKPSNVTKRECTTTTEPTASDSARAKTREKSAPLRNGIVRR